MEEGVARGSQQKIIPVGEISGIDNLKGHWVTWVTRVTRVYWVAWVAWVRWFCISARDKLLSDVPVK